MVKFTLDLKPGTAKVTKGHIEFEFPRDAEEFSQMRQGEDMYAALQDIYKMILVDYHQFDILRAKFFKILAKHDIALEKE